ncbi:selenide, water dikinase SelD [Sulfitobacter aestuarii]|uniref:Selenide, water dikinase SelD n=1 Tax=Sulfitobacter aestuarii TaxID=2161676 RepID=A0ABW5TX88_9RHOB
MEQNSTPLTRDLVLVGGGHAHALVLRRWGMNPLPGARLTLINPGATAPYTGMLPGHVAGHYGRDELEIDLVRLCRFAGARLVLDRATGIDRIRREIRLAGREPLAYDVASIDIGITARMDLPGFAEHAVAAKPLDVFAARWREFLAAVADGTTAPQVAVIGGGVAGCELALAMAHALQQTGAQPQVSVIEAGSQLSGFSPRGRARIMHALARQNIDLCLEAQVIRIEAGRVILRNRAPVRAALSVGAAGAFAHPWIAQSDLPQEDGFITIDRDLGVVGDKALFAVGDCARMPFAPRPKAGVFAVRAAPVLHDNLRVALRGGGRRAFRPQKHYLKLISLGNKSAVAEKYGLAVSGPLLWRWKDRIDRKFMEKFADLPVMPPPPLPRAAALGVRGMLEAKPLCGGCGAKVGGGVLDEALGALGPRQGAVVTGVGDDAAVLRQDDGSFQVISTDHLRAMIEDHAQMARIAAVHALGDVFAMGARPQVALASLILPRMAPELQARSLGEVTRAAEAVFAAIGAQLVGGHTTMGAEWTIGFTVTGQRDCMPITVAGAQPGDLLVLTRPIGSGVIMAGHMAGSAPGPAVVAALAQMERPQDREAALLAKAHAMTDVTGFGLAGHVQAICRASGLGATLWLDKIPVYEVARALSGQGVGSVLLNSNRENAPTSGRDEPLLHDPQTAGGLLASLPEVAANDAVAALQAEGLNGWIIGRMVERSGAIEVR